MIYRTAIITRMKKEEEYDIVLEKQRVKTVAREHAEIHPPYTSDCPICLESKPITNFKSMGVIPCCGGEMCYECFVLNGFSRLKCCPLCRGNSTPDDHARLIKLRAEKGHPLLQLHEGQNYMNGSEGYPVDIDKALKLINLAVEQRHPTTLHYMGLLYKDGVDGFVPQSDSKTLNFMKQAADLGYTDAMVRVTEIYWGPKMAMGMNSEEDEDLQNAILYTTLAYSQSSQEILMKTEAGCGILAYNMGSMFRNAFTDHYKAFPNLSKLQLIFRAKHYFEEAAMMGFENAFFYLAATLLDLATFEDRTPSVLTYTYYAPRILFWCRKGAKVKRTKSQATEMIKDLEKVWKQSCASCWKRADPNNDSFKRCARCKSAWYCSKECQVKHWASHKSDCLGKAPATKQKRGGS